MGLRFRQSSRPFGRLPLARESATAGRPGSGPYRNGSTRRIAVTVTANRLRTCPANAGRARLSMARIKLVGSNELTSTSPSRPRAMSPRAQSHLRAAKSLRPAERCRVCGIQVSNRAYLDIQPFLPRLSDFDLHQGAANAFVSHNVGQGSPVCDSGCHSRPRCLAVSMRSVLECTTSRKLLAKPILKQQDHWTP